jgi:uncharacterized protein YegJ (DUF2314 family)
MRYISPLLLLIICSACPKSVSSSKPRVSILSRSYFTPILVYLTPGESIQPSFIIDEAKKLIPDFTNLEEVPDSILFDAFQIKTLTEGDEGFISPGITLLLNTFVNMSEEETERFGKAKQAIAISFFGTKDNVVDKQKSICDFIYALVKDKKVTVADVSTFEFFSPTLWKEARVDNFTEKVKNITGHVTIHLYREEEFCRAVTMGMNKFCLPEISIKNFPCSYQNTFGNIINATIQTLSENPFVFADSTLMIDLTAIKNDSVRKYLLVDIKNQAKKVAQVKLRSVIPEEGDNPNFQLLIEFNDNNYSSPQEQQIALADNLFGSKDSLSYVQHDEKLLEASQHARLRLPELRQLFSKGLEPGYSIMVKCPFPTKAGGNEWMWIEVTMWNGEEMQGVLQNDPYEIDGLKAGAIVDMKESKIFDYLLYKPDGTFEGNETGKIIEGQN